MDWREGALWGAFGGFAIEAIDYVIAVRRWRKLPWKVGAHSLSDPKAMPAQQSSDDDGAPGLIAYLIAAGLRIALGLGGAAAFTAANGETMNAWLAVILGAAVPYVFEKVTLFVPFIGRVAKEGFAAVQAQAAAQNQEQSPSLPPAASDASGQEGV
ncbi:hypothetical protein [Streptomyces sp. HUAS ZL42]|uniref:hypothetical protein n=1 Tax=Streptomyces sp. HUAS ZL42 TaxID=3231715 RepID=UPI00345E142C